MASRNSRKIYKKKKDKKQTKINKKRGGSNIVLYPPNYYNANMNVHFPSRNYADFKGGFNKNSSFNKKSVYTRKNKKGGNIFSTLSNQSSNPISNFFDANVSSRIINGSLPNVNPSSYIQPLLHK